MRVPGHPPEWTKGTFYCIEICIRHSRSAHKISLCVPDVQFKHIKRAEGF